MPTGLLLHTLSYALLTIVVTKLGVRLFLVSRINHLIVHDGGLLRAKKHLADVMRARALEVSLLEALIVIAAHFLLCAGCIIELQDFALPH